MNIPILMYHEVEPATKLDKRYTVDTVAFERQLDFLRQRDVQTVLLDTLTAPVATRKSPERSVAITFDDSHVVHYTNSLPRLIERKLTATFFVVTSFLGTDRAWLTKDQIRAMHAAGMSIQSHSHTHPFLDTLSAGRIRAELADSKALLEDWLGAPVHYLSCPGGRFNNVVRDVATELGYRGVCTSAPGLATAADNQGASVWPRLLMTNRTSDNEFRRIAEGDPYYILTKRLGYIARRMAKRCLGNDLYYSLWTRLIKNT